MTTEEAIHRKKRAYCLGRLRDARALVLRDGEAFHEAATALEQIGQVIGKEVKIGLGAYRETLLDLAEEAGRHERSSTMRLFKVVCEARNMAVHDGAWARHLSSRLIDLFLILEEAIMATTQKVEDIMVRNPVVAEPWHMITQVRREMLANSFSWLPISHNGVWMIISDADIMHYLRRSSSLTARKEIEAEKCRRLSATLAEVMTEGGLIPVPATRSAPGNTIANLVGIMKNHPVLVIEGNEGAERLVGIVTPFDLL